MTAMAAESTPPPPPPVAEAFVMVLIGFGGGWAAIWRLPAMVGVVEVSNFLVKMARKERNQQKNLLRTNGVQNHRGGIDHIGTHLKVR